MNPDSRVYVAGHRGLVGSAILRRLNEAGFKNVIVRPKDELDLRDQHAVDRFFEDERPEYVFLAAAKVGGIHANKTYPADFIYDNLTISANVIHAAAKHDVKKLMFLGSSCIYPKMAPQPIQEESLLTGPLEPTNEAYAIAKIAGLKLCEMYARQHSRRFISVMPCNLYGPFDNFHPENSHVIPGMMRRFHEAKERNDKTVTIWGSGRPMREFLYVDDLADALYHLMNVYEDFRPINVGSGVDCTIAELAETMRIVTGFKGDIEFDLTKPDGTPRKIMDSSRMRDLGWYPRTPLINGLVRAYHWAYGTQAASLGSSSPHASTTS